MVTLCTEINLGALSDKKGHSSSIQTVKDFCIVLGAMSRQRIKNIYLMKQEQEGEKLSFNWHPSETTA